jgi:hypothetical protein
MHHFKILLIICANENIELVMACQALFYPWKIPLNPEFLHAIEKTIDN